MPAPTGLLINWTDVVEVAKTEQDLRKLDVYSFDLMAVASIAPGATNDQYSIVINSESVDVFWSEGDTEGGVSAKLVNAINNNRVIYRIAHAQGKQENTIDRKGANFAEELEIMSTECWAPLIISKSTNIGLMEGLDGEPIRLGGRSRIMEFTAEWIKASFYGTWTKTAQALFAAHRGTMFAGPSAGQGTKASESYAGESMAWTMPTNNPTAKEELLVTNYGKILNGIKEKIIKQQRMGRLIIVGV